MSLTSGSLTLFTKENKQIHAFSALKLFFPFPFQVEHKYQEKTGADCPKLGKLHSSYSWLKEGSRAPSVASGSSSSATAGTTTKYTDPNYV